MKGVASMKNGGSSGAQSGGSYDLRAAAAAPPGSLEEALRAALTIMEERMAVAEQLAAQAFSNNRRWLGLDYEQKACQTRRHAVLIRDLLDKNSDTLPEEKD